MKPPTVAHLLAILNGIDYRALEAELDNDRRGAPRAASLEPQRGHGVSDPVGEAATHPGPDHHAIYRRHIDAAYRAVLAIAALAEARTPTHQPRRATIAADTRPCHLHDRAGATTQHHQGAHRTDLGSFLDKPLPQPADVCEACYQFARRAGRVPTNDELLRHDRSGRWSLRSTRASVFSAEQIVGEWEQRGDVA